MGGVLRVGAWLQRGGPLRSLVPHAGDKRVRAMAEEVKVGTLDGTKTRLD